ncbi:hypothetical protein RJ639_045083 [Escallonia herrerae]|uniref:Uncharacterized protein n=1 Tax=Escallonia herrerae TaxID=1293975 RepID=A0AA88W9H4_9ASTE|nr:hypothetical protein RJ639_045083 [Escallonia herrerae]
MASSDSMRGPLPPGDGSVPPGKPMTVGQQVLDKGAQLMQSLKPVKQMKQHVCTFASYSHDMTRQIETHHFVTRINHDFLQCAVYDSDESNARLIGVEYIVSGRLFETLEPQEQKLWHSHAYEFTYENPSRYCVFLSAGHFNVVCTGDKLPLGAPALMMSPQGVNLGIVKPDLVERRDAKYKISTASLKATRDDIPVPETINPFADYWNSTGKGFATDIEETEMKKEYLFRE